MKRKYILAILFLAITITFCGTATAEEQNNIQDTPTDTNPQTTVNDQATTSHVQNKSTVDTSITTSTQNNIQSTQSDTNPQTTVNNQAANNETTQNTQNSTNNDITATANEDPVVITFDDGFESVYTIAFPIMQQYGIKGTVYVVPLWIDAPGYLTLAQLTALHNAGWTIASHTWDHPALPTLTTAQITTELQSAITWLNSNGFSDGAYHLAYPYGQYNDNALQVASNLGIKTARTVDWGIITSDGYTLPWGDPLNYLELPIILIRNDTTRTDWQTDLDLSIAQSGTAIFLFHDIVTGNPTILEDITVDTFREIIEYINQTGVRTETISQWYNEITNIDSITLSITADKTNYNVGENVVYNLNIFNNGANAATNIVITDTLPAGLTFVSATQGGVYNAGVITWNLANLAANSHFTPSFTATVNQGTQGQNIQNTASTSSTQIPTPVTSQVTIHINSMNPTAEIIINFDDGAESVYLNAFPIMQQYGIKGTVYVVTDWIGQPGYLSLAQLTALHNAGWTIANHSWRHYWLPELTSTQITTEIQTAADYLNNNGFQDGAYHFAYPYGAYEEFDDRVLQVCSQLGIKTARTIESGTINPNSNINYLELPSNGFTRTTTTAQWKSWVDQAIATDTTSIILLHSIVSNPSITEDVSVTTFTAFIQYLAQTGIKTLTINQWYNESQGVTLTIGVADVAVYKYIYSGRYTQYDDACIVYNIVAYNLSTSANDATNVRVTNLIPAGFQFIAANPRGTDSGTYNETTGVWSINRIAIDGYAYLDLVLKVIGTGTRDNTGFVTADEYDSNMTNNDAVNTPGVSPLNCPNVTDIAITQTVNNNTPTPGSTVTFAVKVKNNGPLATNNVQATCQLDPAIFENITSSNPSAYNTSTGVWNVGTLDDGQEMTLYITAVIKNTIPTGTSVAVIANRTGTIQYPDQLSDNNSQKQILVIGGPVPGSGVADVAIYKYIYSGRYTQYDDACIVYNIVAYNLLTSANDATNVRVTNLIPAGFQFIAANPRGTDSGTYNETTGVWSINRIAIDGYAYLDLVLKVIGTGTRDNTGFVTADEYDSNMTNNDAVNTPGVSPLNCPNVTDIAITQTVNNNTPTPGSTVTFAVKVKNNGPLATNNVQATCQLDPAIFENITSSNPSAYNTSTGVWNVGTLDDGQEMTLYITAVIKNTIPTGTSVAVIANRTGTIQYPDQLSDNNSQLLNLLVK